MFRYSFYCVGLLLLIPAFANAFSGAGDIARLNESVFMYTETITFGSKHQGLSLPIEAVPNWRPGTNPKSLKYQINIGGRPFAGLDTTGAVLSRSPIVNGRYVIEAGETASFTLMVLLNIPNQTSSSGDGREMLDVTVTKFPVLVEAQKE